MSSYQQVLAGTPLTVTEQFLVDGSAIDLDSGVGTLTLFKPDGSAFTPVPTVTHVGAAGSGQYRFVLDAQADPYVLTYKLAGPIGGKTVTLAGTVEWVGALLFNTDEFRALKVAGSTPFSSTATYPNSVIQQARADVLDEFTEILGFSPVSRYRREVHSVASWGEVVLKQPLVTKLLTVTVNGTTSATSGYYVDPGGSLLPVSAYVPSVWTAYGIGNVAVEYVAGWDRLRGGGRDAALLYAGAKLNPAGWSTATSVTLPTGESYSYEPSEVGRLGYQRFTGIKPVDRWLNLNRPASTIAGVA